jgi:hypothetical protein
MVLDCLPQSVNKGGKPWREIFSIHIYRWAKFQAWGERCVCSMMEAHIVTRILQLFKITQVWDHFIYSSSIRCYYNLASSRTIFWPIPSTYNSRPPSIRTSSSVITHLRSFFDGLSPSTGSLLPSFLTFLFFPPHAFGPSLLAFALKAVCADSSSLRIRSTSSSKLFSSPNQSCRDTLRYKSICSWDHGICPRSADRSVVESS